MSTRPYLPPPVPAELPDWILALKPLEADQPAGGPAESVVFIGLDEELEALLKTNPEDIEWLAQVAEQPLPPMSPDEAASILEGHAKPVSLPMPHKRRRKMRQAELLVLDALLALMIIAILALVFMLKYVLQLF
jgi:hypothetical protein